MDTDAPRTEADSEGSSHEPSLDAVPTGVAPGSEARAVDHQSDAGSDLDDQEQVLGGAGNGPAIEPVDLAALVHYVVSKLVSDPDAIEITSEQRGGTVYLALRVPEADLGRVIGREGRTAKAIRTLVSIAGSKAELHARLDIDG